MRAFLQILVGLFALAQRTVSSSQSVFELSSHSLPLITPELSSALDELLSSYNTPGLSLSIIRRRQSPSIQWDLDFYNYGVFDEHGNATGPNTQYAIASNSKLFLALTIGSMIEKEVVVPKTGEKLAWETKAKDLLPDWGLWDKEAESETTIEDMLCHRSGIPAHDGSRAPSRENGLWDTIATLRYLRPSAPFRSAFQYSNLPYLVLATLPELLLNQTYHSYLSETFFKPLNLTMTTTSIAAASSSGHFSRGFVRSLPSGELKPLIPHFLRPGGENMVLGAGGIISTAKDMATFNAMLLLWGEHPHEEGKRILKEDTVRRVSKGIMVTSGAPLWPEISVQVYGMGQERLSYRGKEVIGHNGGHPGFKSIVVRFPHENIGISVFTNDDVHGNDIARLVEYMVADNLFGLEPIDWAARWKDRSLFKPSLPIPLSEPTPPSRGFASLEGNYSHPSYPHLSLCFLQNPSPSPYCSSLLSSPSIQFLIEATNATSSPTLLSIFPQSFATHFMLTHVDGNIFQIQTYYSNYEVRRAERLEDFGEDIAMLGGDGMGSGIAEWIEDERGWSLRGNWWGQGYGTPVLTGVAREGAEVWFDLDV